ncbi:LysR family transcriptional regulator [Pseudorhodobacter aquimaris]|uniref:LysR family transcriptional regulator n=1 Tax=Pseudorhodobacter aquimaris TaxID=687412 RepID=UPI00067CAEC2|nr:LysR family transcriptional regulator [Pseudorhodobacter aquimaris]
MDNWDEIRTAYQVARAGTVSGAAEVLGVHHATVIRHVDALEKRLGEKLFHRHARGYATTEAGRDLLTVAQITEDQFAQLANRIRGKGETVSGDLALTSIADISAQMVQCMVAFQTLYPEVTPRFLTGQRLFRLDYGEAHVAVRAGAAPAQADYVVQPFMDLRHALYASASYAAANGLPETDADLADHRFVVSDETSSRAPYSRWLQAVTPTPALRFRASDPAAMYQAISAGAGIGFISRVAASSYPDLIEVMPPRPEWDVPLWLVTHIDLHRTLKVQRFLSHLKETAVIWRRL